MKRLVEETFHITAKQAAQALSSNSGQSTVEFEIAGCYVQQISLVSTPGNAGGRVYWVLCPGCDGRVRKLYLPPDEAVFLCRRCHDLGYRAQQSRTYRHNRNIFARGGDGA